MTTYLKSCSKSAKISEKPSCQSVYDAWKAGDVLSSLSTEKARNDLVARKGSIFKLH